MTVVMESLPRFDLKEYVQLLTVLRQAGYGIRPVSDMPKDDGGQFAYLRHDIDASLELSLPMARAEANESLKATYGVMLAATYNLFYPENVTFLKELIALGHEIGLHYDLSNYPSEPVQAWQRLERETQLLQTLTGKPVLTISMHQPHRGLYDFFRQTKTYVHPHDPRWQEDVMYVSDSCRAWRDCSLLRCFAPDSPRRLLLLTHPEVWLDGGITCRFEYLDKILMPGALRQPTDYFDQEIRQTWKTHVGANMHDERERRSAVIPERAS